MRLPQFCVHHPVATFVLQFLMILLGIVGYNRLAVRQFPQIERQQIQVSCLYSGASSELIEREITSPIESALSGIEGISRLTSTSSENTSTIQLELDWGVSAEQIMSTLRDRLSGVQDSLPEHAHTPQIYRKGSDNPLVMYLSFQDKNRSLDELFDYLERYTTPALQRLKGVSEVSLHGGSTLAVRVYPDPQRMAARGVTVADIGRALKTQNMILPSGKIHSDNRVYPISLKTTLTQLSDFKNVVVASKGTSVVRLSDVAEVIFGPDPGSHAHALLDGQPTLFFQINADQSANPIEVSQNIHRFLADLQKNLPPGQTFTVLHDATRSIQASFQSVYRTMLEATALVALVMWAFLGSFRAALIPIVTIPVCLIGVAFFLYLLHFSVNNLTLLAAVLAIGLVVDDAIVMVENVFRRLEKGDTVLSAVLASGQEIGFAILAMTTTLAAVYAPIAFAEGLSGKLFREFALTLSGSVLISGLVALTLSPVLCARWLKSAPKKAILERFLSRLSSWYAAVLPILFRRAGWGFLWLALLFGIGWFAYRGLPQEFAPQEDTSEVFVSITSPVGASHDFVARGTEQITQIVRRLPETERQLSFTGFDVVFLKPRPIRTVRSSEIAERLFAPLQSVPGVHAYPYVMPPLPMGGGGKGERVSFYVRNTTSEYPEINKVARHIQSILQKNSNFRDVDVDFRPNSAQLVLDIDRQKAALLGVSIVDIAETIQALFAGVRVTRYETGGQLYDVRIHLPLHARKSAEALSHFYVRNNAQQMIPISSLVRQSESVISNIRQHLDRMRAIQVSVRLASGYALSQAVQDIRTVLKKELPETYEVVWGGQVHTFLKEGHTMLVTFALALLFIYLVLSAQFESFFDPFIILLTVPCSMAGGLVLLKLVGGSLNIYTQIAFITLMGLITKHGILIVEFASSLQRQGVELVEAISRSATLRLRPILMTTAAMVFGAVPLIWASGYGAVSRSQMGWVILGGMLIGTLFSLTVMPLAYWALYRLRYWIESLGDRNTPVFNTD